MFVLLLAILALAGGALFNPTFAQTQEPSSRAEALRQEREQKQGNLTPNRPDALQRGMDYVEDRGLFLLTKDGFYPKIGTLTTGSGSGGLSAQSVAKHTLDDFSLSRNSTSNLGWVR